MKQSVVNLLWVFYLYIILVLVMDVVKFRYKKCITDKEPIVGCLFKIEKPVIKTKEK